MAGQRTAADGAIRAAGLQNAMQGFDHYRAMSQEGGRQPCGSGGDLRRWSQRDGRRSRAVETARLGADPAGRHKQLLTIDDMALLGFGPRTPQAIIALREKAEHLP